MGKVSAVLMLVFVTCLTTLAEGKEAGGARRLNNFVLEYVNTSLKAPRKDYLDSPFKTFEIDHFRNGWLFIRGQTQGGAAYVTIDSDARDEAVLVLEEKTDETMRYVSKGKHRINIFTKGVPKIENFTIRSIPELQVAELHFATHKPGFGDPNVVHRKIVHDWDFYRKNINPNVNVIISERDGNREWEPYAKEWRRQGKKWLFKTSGGINFGLLEKLGEDSFEEYYYGKWGKPLEEISYLDGIAIDEWTDAKQWADTYPVFAKLYDRVARNPACRGKKLYTYGMRRLRDWYKPGIESIMRNNFVYLLEGYYFLREKAIPGDEQDHQEYIEQYASKMLGILSRQYPGFIQNNMVYTFGTFNYHASLDVTPVLDFKVFLDMQFYHLANHPVFEDLYGAQLYTTPATTTDILQYASALYRYYCIEGNRERFNNDPLRLTYLSNPGFEQGLTGWQVRAAGPDSVKVLTEKNLPVQKRNIYNQVPPSQKKVLCTVRSENAPNVISQRITGLEPGKLYSLTLYVSDYSDVGKFQLVPASIGLGGVEELTKKNEDRTIYTGDYEGAHRVCWNYRFRVFRAKETSAKLTLSDWGATDAPAGDIGHNIIWDYVKVQPYYGKEKR